MDKNLLAIKNFDQNWYKAGITKGRVGDLMLKVTVLTGLVRNYILLL